MASAADFGTMAMFPLQSALLPGQDLPLQIFEPRYAQLVRDCMRDNEPRFGVVLISQGREVGGGDVRCDVGTVAEIADCVEIASSGRFILSCRGPSGSRCASGCRTTRIRGRSCKCGSMRRAIR